MTACMMAVTKDDNQHNKSQWVETDVLFVVKQPALSWDSAVPIHIYLTDVLGQSPKSVATENMVTIYPGTL